MDKKRRNLPKNRPPPEKTIAMLGGCDEIACYDAASSAQRAGDLIARATQAGKRPLPRPQVRGEGD